MVVLRPVFPAAEPAFLQHRDAGDAVQFCEVVRRRETVSAAADDHDVVLRLRLRAAPRPRPPPVVAQRVSRKAEYRIPHARHPRIRTARLYTGSPGPHRESRESGASSDFGVCPAGPAAAPTAIRHPAPLPATAFTWRRAPGGSAIARMPTGGPSRSDRRAAGVEGRRPAPATPRHPRLPLPLLPSGPDGVYDLAMRGDRCGPPSTG